MFKKANPRILIPATFKRDLNDKTKHVALTDSQFCNNILAAVGNSAYLTVTLSAKKLRKKSKQYLDSRLKKAL